MRPLLFMLLVCAAAAQTMPTHIPPRRSSQIQDGFGINADMPRDPYIPWQRWWWTRMFDGGLSFIRIGQYENSGDYTSWDWIERRRGDYAVEPVLDDVVDSLNDNGIHILVQLIYGNPMYTSVAGKLPDSITSAPGSFHNPDRSLYSIFWPPKTLEQIEAFNGYVRFLVNRYRGKVRYWELWNEPNIEYWNPHHDPAEYGRLAKAVIPVIKQADSHAQFVFGALAGADIEWARKALAACQCSSAIDIFSYHIYPDYGRNMNPEAMDDAAHQKESPRRLREMVRAFPGIRADLVFWNDEFNSIPSWIGSDDSVQIKYIPRGLLYDHAQGVRTFVWLIVGATDGNELDDFGMLRGLRYRPDDFTPRPAWQALEHTNWLFADTHRDPRISISGPQSSAGAVKYGFRSRSGKAIIAYWLPAYSEPGNHFPVMKTGLQIAGSGIQRPVLIDITSGSITPLEWKSGAPGTLENLPLKDAVMAIADASYFDWPILPEAPSGLSVELRSNSAELKWEPHDGAKAIVVERRGNDGGWQKLARLDGAGVQYTDRDAPQSGAYRVRAANDTGQSAYSNVVRIQSRQSSR